jgi:hypothetical protein
MGPVMGVAAVREGAVTAKHAGRQLDTALTMEQLGLRKKASNARFGHLESGLKLRRKASRREMKNIRASIPLGLAGLGFAGFESKRRGKMLETQAADQKELYNLYKRNAELQHAYMRGPIYNPMMGRGMAGIGGY